VSGFWLLRRHLSYAHRLKIVDNRKKNRTNCSNKQQTETTTTNNNNNSRQFAIVVWLVLDFAMAREEYWLAFGGVSTRSLSA